MTRIDIVNQKFALQLLSKWIRTRGKINTQNYMTPRRFAAADDFDHAAAVSEKTGGVQACLAALSSCHSAN